MPLELGIAVGHRLTSGEASHDWLILVPEGHRYIRFISDLAGYDPVTHNGTVEMVIPKVMAWLATRPDSVYVPTPERVLAALPAFEAERRRVTDQWRGELPWADLVLVARSFVPD